MIGFKSGRFQEKRVLLRFMLIGYTTWFGLSAYYKETKYRKSSFLEGYHIRLVNVLVVEFVSMKIS